MGVGQQLVVGEGTAFGHVELPLHQTVQQVPGQFRVTGVTGPAEDPGAVPGAFDGMELRAGIDGDLGQVVVREVLVLVVAHDDQCIRPGLVHPPPEELQGLTDGPVAAFPLFGDLRGHVGVRPRLDPVACGVPPPAP